jgi:hypothetical protein
MEAPRRRLTGTIPKVRRRPLWTSASPSLKAESILAVKLYRIRPKAPLPFESCEDADEMTPIGWINESFVVIDAWQSLEFAKGILNAFRGRWIVVNRRHNEGLKWYLLTRLEFETKTAGKAKNDRVEDALGLRKHPNATRNSHSAWIEELLAVEISPCGTE